MKPEIDEILEMVEALDADPPPEVAAPWPVPWWRSRGVALAAALVLCVMIPATLMDPFNSDNGIGLKGVSSAQKVDLRMVIESGGGLTRLGDRAAVGDQVVFRVASEQPGRVWLWVEGPEGQQALAEADADAEPVDVRGTSGLLGYRFERRGVYTFFASAVEGSCPPDACAHRSVEVE